MLKNLFKEINNILLKYKVISTLVSIHCIASHIEHILLAFEQEENRARISPEN